MWYKRFFLLFFLLLIGLPLEAFPQHVPSSERGDPTLRRKTDIDGNNIRATIFNTGLTGRTGVVPGEIPYEWPKNTKRYYIALTGIFIGGEVSDLDGNPLQVVDVVQYRSSPSGKSWSFEPVPGYMNPNYTDPNANVGIAKSTDPQSWPPNGWADKMDDPVDPGWVGSWNGYFGKNIFNADQELFYKMSDDLYDRYLGTFYPDSTDLTRGGLGLLVETRVMAWSQILVNDVIYVINNIKNDGTTNIRKTAFTIWLADLVGGDGDSQDDRISYDILEDIAWCRDADGVGNAAFQGQRVGVAGVSFLETPGNAIDRIDNDGDGEPMSPIITQDLLEGEDPTNLIDDNGNGLIDENETHIPFNGQAGVGYADGLDNNGNGELGSPVVTAQMIAEAQNDRWHRWPPNPENDPLQNGQVHLIGLSAASEGLAFKDNIDNDDNGEIGSPVITQEIIDAAAADPYKRYRVPGTNIILYDVGPEDLGKKYADGIDNDGNGAVDEYIDQGIDEMIDESREDHIDNDGDWNPATDDVGLDGVPNTGDPGEGDGVPTSGAGTNFPGEPNIDKTDISESDQLGITNVQYDPAGSINFNTSPDRFFWLEYMIPGDFYTPPPGGIPPGDNDLFVTSSFFPLKAGTIERISYAVILGEDTVDVLNNRKKAQETYNVDYQFARAPIVPKLWAVPGDNQVTLYWDSEAEKSFDSYMANLGQPAYDFEGYRLYRSSDAAFEDPFIITDGKGTKTFRKPIQQWDLVDQFEGYHPVDIEGIKFYLGSNTGLVHAYVDKDVQNGFTYYYALTSYDFGNAALDIAPAESPILITIDQLGNAKLGQNVVKVVPEAPVAGYQPPVIGDLIHVQGGASGEIKFTVVDPRLVKDNHIYRITFQDTIVKASKPTEKDTLTTKNFSLFDVTDPLNPDTLVWEDPNVRAGQETPLVDGFRLEFINPQFLRMDPERSQWNRSGIYNFVFKEFKYGSIEGALNPADYVVEFGEVGMDTSQTLVLKDPNLPPIFWVTLDAKPVNFRVKNVTENRYIDFAFWELDGDDGRFTGRTDETDIIIFLEKNQEDSLVVTWSFSYQTGSQFEDPNLGFPEAGDYAEVFLTKPFLSNDIFEFTTHGEYVDRELARNELDRIKVVPNPYVAASRFETRNPFQRGRGPRAIHFIHLPQRCTIRIYTVNGELVKVIEHNSSMQDGTAEWNLLSRDNLAVSYGIYIYHIDAPGIGEKVGKFAIIK